MSLPRGIPAASLKHPRQQKRRENDPESSAGNTRGLIEAGPHRGRPDRTARLPRGIPAASLKLRAADLIAAGLDDVFRGEYPRPH